MKTIETRFGEISYDPEKVIRFPEGLVGFEQLREFVVMPNKREDDPLFCIQSVEQAHLAFLLIAPDHFFPDYKVTPAPEVFQKLGITSRDQYFILTMITFHQDDTITLNLLAPVVYTPATDRAVQVILEGSGYKAKTPLPQKK